MRLPRRLLTLLLPITFTTACIDNIDSADETTSEVDSELSTANWGLTTRQAISLYGAQVASVNGTTYMVHTDPDNKTLYWKKRTGWQRWSAAVEIPDQRTSDQVSLAVLDGFLYMVHVGETDTSAVWFSRFDPVTETWTPNRKLEGLSTDIGAPALAGFDGRLWLVGGTTIDDYNNQLWVATLTPDASGGGAVGGPVNIRYRRTTTRPSLAVFAGKLFLAYNTRNSIYTITHTAGTLATAWSAPSGVTSGPQGTYASGWDAKIASAGGYLHLVHTLPGHPLDVFWTYWDQCKWAPEVRFDNQLTNRAPSLTDGGTGLILTREALSNSSTGSQSYEVLTTEYTAPPPPMTVPKCTGTVGF